MKDFTAYLQQMGLLHDCVVEQFCWKPSEQLMEFHFDDLYSNFEGLKGYPGKQPGVIRLHGVASAKIDIELDKALTIFEFEMKDAQGDVVQISFAPRGKIEATFQRAEYPAPCLT